MPKRKRPDGQEWEALVERYYASDHSQKVALAEECGVSLDVFKHWISDTGNVRVKGEPPSMRMTNDELLAMRPGVHLDFVTFDLETSNLEADFSIILCACIKPYGQPVQVLRADSYPNWHLNRANDAPIVADIAAELRKHAIVISHYGSKFDIRYFRAKMVKHGLDPLPPMFGIDTWRIAKNNFAVSSRRLKNLANYFELGDKDGVEGPLWMGASLNGDSSALDKIVEHNIIDVEVLEKLACVTFPLTKSIPRL